MGTAVRSATVPPIGATSTTTLASSSSPILPSSPVQHAHHGHSSVVPAYPYNVAMAPTHIAGADDSGITTRLPSICVDYLSHDWQEDDVWASWKAMTKHKAEIANGVRLENASWRTWAKQRGNLKTISPETLNWLKDSDVTWLYGPLHTNVDAVPPPKESTMSDRLGLEPLRTLDENQQVKMAAAAASNAASDAVAPQKPLASASSRTEVKTKPILKHRSLSDILLPPGSSSPVLEDSELVSEDQGTISIHHARSDSHLVRLNSLNRKKKKGSPLTSPRSESPERASDASSPVAHAPKREHRHISFNHRVEQCIAVDADESASARRQPSALANSVTQSTTNEEADDDDDEEDVLTFKSSPRMTSNGPDKLTATKPWEPHTIARLDPTTLKNTEAYPAPSPVVVYQNGPSPRSNNGIVASPTGSISPQPNDTINNRGGILVQGGSSSNGGMGSSISGPYSGQSSQMYAGGGVSGQQAGASSGSRRPMSVYPNAAAMRQSNWDPEDEDDYAMGYDFYVGPDVGVGDEYDMAQYGSTHLVGGTHNDFGQPSYPHVNPYGHGYASPQQQPQHHEVVSSASSSLESTPNHSRASSNLSSSPASSSTATQPPTRGLYQPAPSSRAAGPPKRGILKGSRSREPSSDGGIVGTASPRTSGDHLMGNGDTSSPAGSSAAASPSSSPSASPFGSSSSLGSVGRATAIPQHVRPTTGGRRISSEDGLRERGRSTSRGSSSSLDRAGSADRRSSHSTSPSAYSPPSPSLVGPGAPATSSIGSRTLSSTGGGSRRTSSYDSLGGVAEQAAASGGASSSASNATSASSGVGNSAASGIARSLSNVTEASNESDADSVVEEADKQATSIVKPVGAAINPEQNDRAEAEQIEDVASTSPTTVRATFTDSEPGSSGTATPLATPLHQPDESPLVSSASRHSGATVTKARPAPVSVSASHVPAAPVSPPLVPAPSPHVAVGQRYRQPSPSKATTTTEEDDALGQHSGIASLSNSPALDPTDLASAQWSDESAPSYARRSLLRAARGSSGSSGGAHGALDSLHKTTSRDSAYRGGGGHRSTDGDSSQSSGFGGRGSLDSGRSRSSTDDFGFSLYDDDGSSDSGIMGKTLEVAGTARDLLGAISKSLWGLRGNGRSSGPPSSSSQHHQQQQQSQHRQ
ncbi:protein phosphatase regulator [Microbotryomycetes sp. JL221]|nr:protein phosphatase regulator [Microbotryomycetes sp. JL221]